jgi:glycosyltransferase involved in cell wall biosynthesis
MNPLLSIVIPTYERAESLRINLPCILEEVSQFNIAVYISDDSPSDDIASFCSGLKTTYKNIFYIKKPV